jgi:hypothetical protein
MIRLKKEGIMKVELFRRQPPRDEAEKIRLRKRIRESLGKASLATLQRIIEAM